MAAIRLYELNPAWEVKTELPTGSPSAAIIAKADEWQPDLIVLGFSDLDFGTISIDAEVTLGRYVEGEFRTNQSGIFVSVDAEALDLVGEINATFDLNPQPDGGVLFDVDVTFAASFELG